MGGWWHHTIRKIHLIIGLCILLRMYQSIYVYRNLRTPPIGAETCSVRSAQYEHRHLLRTEVSIYIEENTHFCA
jgi:hypothetical protein